MYGIHLDSMNYKVRIPVALLTACFALCLLLTGCSLFRCSRYKQKVLPASKMDPVGRTTTDSGVFVNLISSASNVGFRFRDASCTILVHAGKGHHHNYIQYELDGVYQKRIRIEGSVSDPLVITAPNDGVHTVTIYKTTEAHTGPVIINKVGGQHIKSIAPTSEPLIEFIGNSITCGAASDASETPCGTGVYHDQHNAYYAYGPRVSRMLHTNFILSSVSGIGIYRTWNVDGPSMPQVYEKTDFQLNSTRLWNFNTYTPRIVSIALGTNDLSKGDGKHEVG